MAELTRRLILASGSPRRREILETMGLSFDIDVSEADESFAGAPDDAVMELSRRKAQAVAPRHPDALVLAADTLVYDGSVLGKPGTPARAAKMHAELSGRWHSVFTGLTLIDTASGRTLSRVCETRVHFVRMAQEEIEDYVRTGEPLDKAGAYGIQGRGGMFIDRIEGSYSNVVGLPMTTLRDMLREISGESGV